MVSYFLGIFFGLIVVGIIKILNKDDKSCENRVLFVREFLRFFFGFKNYLYSKNKESRGRKG